MLSRAEGSGVDRLLPKLLQPLWVAGVACFGLSVLFYSYALTKFELSVAQPVMTSAALVLVFVLSVVLFQESYGWPKIAGAILILAGVALLSQRA